MMEEPFDRVDISGMTRSEWIGMRKLGVGGSDVAPLLGLSPWKSEYELWCEKSGLIEPEDISDKPAVLWGTLLESVIRDRFSQLHPEYDVMKPTEMYRSSNRPWAQANLDGELTSEDGSKGVLEIKTSGFFGSHAWDDGVPVWYMCQVAHYMSVTGYAFAYVAVLIGGQDYREFRVDRDKGDIAYVNRKVDEFWSRVVSGDEPDISASQASGDVARCLFERHRDPHGGYVQLGSIPEAVSDYMAARELYKRAKDNMDAYAAQVKRMIGDSEGVEYPGGKVRWVRTARKSFSSSKLKKERPDIYSEFTDEKQVDLGLRVTEYRE